MSLETPQTVRNLQAALHAKAKGSPSFRFYSLYDKLFRADILSHAYATSKANGGASGVDGRTFEDIESYGAERWLGELAERRTLLKDVQEMTVGLNRLLVGWSNYFSQGSVSKAYRAVDVHVTSRLRRWLCEKHKVSSGGYSRYSDRHLTERFGLVRLPLLPRRYPRANA
jgi:hypothetical protein